jgi:hypothetical protein
MKIDFYSTFLCWMSSVEVCFSSLPWMRQLYINFMASLNQSRDPHSTYYHQQILNLIQDGKPFLWLPDSVPNQADSTGGTHTDLVKGKMWRLSQLVLRDPTEKFEHSLSPIRILSRYYGSTGSGDTNFMSLFSRVRPCRVCVAFEGLFGTQGQPLDGDRRIYEQQCTCEDQSYGQYLQGRQKGLVRTSPNLSDMITLIKNLIGRYDEVEKEGRGSDEMFLISPLELRAKLMQTIKELLGIISKEVWKCFNLENCVHGYNPQALRDLRDEFMSAALLPTIDQHFVTCASSIIRGSHVDEESPLVFAIAVDDHQLFQLFQEDLSTDQNNNTTRVIHWLSGSALEETTLWHEEEISDLEVYELSDYETSFRNFFKLAPNEFYSRASTIPPETFFAPNNIFSLMKFLKIQNLSQYVTSEWILDKQSSQPHRRSDGNTNTSTSTFVSLMNTLLLTTQGFLFQEFSNVIDLNHFVKRQRIQKLLNLTIQCCHNLRRHVTLTLPCLEQQHKKEQAQDYYMNCQENILSLDQNISYSKCCEIVIFMICKAVKVEIALLTLNQQADFMIKLRENLVKYSKIRNFSV